MTELVEITHTVVQVPVENLAILLGLAAIALAAFAIHAVVKVLKEKGRQ